MLKLYGFTSSTCTRLVALVCKEKDIPYELISVNLAKGEQKNPAFVANQPFGQVPYIVSPTLSNLSLSYSRYRRTTMVSFYTSPARLGDT
jgi:glutathione S-transferase